MSARSVTDRRSGQASDLRRAALLRALDAQLRESEGNLEAINVADLTKRAGVTRPAFYFYFASKASAMAAAAEEIYNDVLTATAVLVEHGDPASRVATTIRQFVQTCSTHRHVFRAMLSVRASSPEVRAKWEADGAELIKPVAAMIEAERAAQRAPEGVPAVALATMLRELNERLLERLIYTDGADADALTDAVIAIWNGAIWGRTDALLTDQGRSP